MVSFSPALGEHLAVPLAASHRFTTSYDGTARAEVWTNLSGEWTAHPFTFPSLLSIGTSSAPFSYVDVPLNGSRGEFTYRLVHKDAGIEWLGDAGGNGSISYTTTSTSDKPASVQVIRQPLGKDEVTRFPLPSPNWEVDAGITIERRHSSWVQPRRITSLAEVDDRLTTQFLLVRSADAKRVQAYLPLSSTAASSIIRRGEEGTLALESQRDLPSDEAEALAVVGEAPDYEVHELVSKMVEEARRVVSKVNGMPVKASSAKGDRHALGFCTWNALGNRYQAAQVTETLQALFSADPSLAKAVDTILLDDGWQDITTDQKGDRRLRSFGAIKGWAPDEDPSRLPSPPRMRPRGDSGYSSPTHDAAAIDEEHVALKELTRGIKVVRKALPKDGGRVGVWLALEGYWDGCSGSGPIAEHYGHLDHCKHLSHEHPDRPPHAEWRLPNPAQYDRFWRSYFGGLKEAGIDFVKVDNQAYVDYALDPKLRVEMSRSMTAAARQVWGRDDAVLHCMAHSPRTLTGALGLGLLADGDVVYRNSDDFFPDAEGSHAYHVVWNAANCTLLQHLSLTPDFDQFQSGHAWGAFHAPLRAFSPAPIYITDSPSSHDPNVLRSLVAPRTNGKLVAVQSIATKPIQLALFDDVSHGPAALKLAVPVDEATGAVIGLWNCTEEGEATADVLARRDVAQALRGNGRGDVVVFARSTRKAVFLDGFDIEAEAKRPSAMSEVVGSVTLPQKGSEQVVVAKAQRLRAGTVACVGLVDKYLGLTAVRSASSASFIPPSTAARQPARQTRPVLEGAPSLTDAFANFRERLLQPSLRDNLRRRPIGAITTEVRWLLRAVFSFAFAFFVHVFQHQARARTIEAERQPVGEEKDREGDVLRFEIDLAGQLGFVVRDIEVKVSIDGQVVDEAMVTRSENLVVVDMERFVAGADRQGDRWLIEVRL